MVKSSTVLYSWNTPLNWCLIFYVSRLAISFIEKTKKSRQFQNETLIRKRVTDPRNVWTFLCLTYKSFNEKIKRTRVYLKNIIKTFFFLTRSYILNCQSLELIHILFIKSTLTKFLNSTPHSKYFKDYNSNVVNLHTFETPIFWK